METNNSTIGTLVKDSLTDDLPIRSPCISNCCLDDEDICLGCFRHIDEITGWHSAINDQRSKILDNTRQRQKLSQDS